MSRVARWSVVIVGLVVLALLVTGCGRPSAQTNSGTPAGANKSEPAAKETIKVMVPCGQVGPFDAVTKLFEKQNPGVKLDWMPENMVTITELVLDGKEQPDAFLSMGDLEVDRLEKAGKTVPGTRVAYAENALAITVPADNPAGVHSIADLAKPSVEAIVVPDPKLNSVGVHGIEALKGAGIWAQSEGKISSPKYAADGKEMSQSGQVPVSIGYYPCVSEVHIKGQAPAKPKDIVMIGLVPQEYYKAFSCEGVVVKGCKNPEGGKKVLAMLKTPEAQAIFKEWNFSRTITPAK